MPATMHAMVCEGPGRPLVARTLPRPEPGPGEVRIDVAACGVCRTDLHLVDGELPDPRLPVIPGHEIVGRIAALGPGVTSFALGTRVGVPWLGATCGQCGYCTSGRENLCADARFTGYQIDGGYADSALADARFVLPLPDRYDDLHAAPLLCAGLIGYRAYAMAGEARIARPLRVRRRRASDRASRGGAGANGLRVHPSGGLRRAALRARAGRPVGRRQRRAGSVAARCGADLRPGRAARSRGAGGDGARGHGHLRRHSHERHSRISVPAPVGRAQPPLGREPHARRRPCVSRARGDACRWPCASSRFRCPVRTRRWPASGPVPCQAPPY